jgi:hypothetical protein
MYRLSIKGGHTISYAKGKDQAQGILPLCFFGEKLHLVTNIRLPNKLYKNFLI